MRRRSGAVDWLCAAVVLVLLAGCNSTAARWAHIFHRDDRVADTGV